MSLGTAFLSRYSRRERLGAQPAPVGTQSKKAEKAFTLTRRYHEPMPDRRGNGQSGYFFQYRNRLFVPGNYVLRFHVQSAEAVVKENKGVLKILCVDPSAPFFARRVARLAIKIGPELIARGDELILRFEIRKRCRLEIRGHVTRGLGQIMLRNVEAHIQNPGEIIDYDNTPGQFKRWPRTRIRGLMVGTNGDCNASCSSCPTNKTVRAHLPTGIMSMDLFKKLIDGIADGDIELEKNKMGLGLFGEPLMDPLIVERVRYVRERLPHVNVLLNTNAGPFNERRHAELIELVHRFSVHVEAISPDIYEKLMEPLRAHVVFPKIERLIALAPGKVNIAVPISRYNKDEYPELKRYWLAKGARHVEDLALSNRTTDSLSYADQSLGPTPNTCSGAVGFDFVVDWDGKVLACCQDFMKREVLGDLNKNTVREILESQRRKEFAASMAQGCWNALESCRHCKRDLQSARSEQAEAEW